MISWFEFKECTWVPGACAQEPLMTPWPIKCHFPCNLASTSDLYYKVDPILFESLKSFLAINVTHNLGILRKFAQTWENSPHPGEIFLPGGQHSSKYIHHLQLLCCAPPPVILPFLCLNSLHMASLGSPWRNAVKECLVNSELSFEIASVARKEISW